LGKLALHEIDGEEKQELVTCEPEELQAIVKEDTQYEITVLEEKLAQMKPNMAAIAEYRKKVQIRFLSSPLMYNCSAVEMFKSNYKELHIFEYANV